MIYEANNKKSLFLNMAFSAKSMQKMAHSGHQHRNLMFIGCIHRILIFHAAAGLYDGFNSLLCAEIYDIPEREKRIGSQNQITAEILLCSLYRLLCSPNPIDLTATDSQSLNSVGNHDGIGFYIFYYSLRKK